MEFDALKESAHSARELLDRDIPACHSNVKRHIKKRSIPVHQEELVQGAPLNVQVSSNSNDLFSVSFLNSLDKIPKYKGLTGTAICFAMNPTTGNMVEVRALLDSGANLTMINKNIAKAIGLTGKTISVSLNVAGGESFTKKETEVVFQLVKRDRSHVTVPVVGITTESVGNPFSPIDFKPGKHAHLKDLSLADKFPAPRERPFQLLLSEPYFTMFERDERRMADDPALPIAVNTELGWVLRGSTGVDHHIP